LPRRRRAWGWLAAAAAGAVGPCTLALGEPLPSAAADDAPLGAAEALESWTPSQKTSSRLVTRAQRRQAVANCQRYPWAAQMRDQATAEARPWLEMSDERLWKLLTSQGMPRDTLVNFHGQGCPRCGPEQRHAARPVWRVQVLERPWQVQCGHCQQWFPSNDFAAYYASALDDAHRFQLGRGDRRFLQPRPEGGNPLWIDDGLGVRVGDQQWFFAAFYAAQIWLAASQAVENLAVAYTLTDDPAYAHKAGVLLDRMADLYPDMDYAPWHALGMEASTGGSGKGRVAGRIAECYLAHRVSRAYDLAFDALREDAELAAFSARMAVENGAGGKGSVREIVDHIENNLIKQFIRGVLEEKIAGNEGMTQHAMAAAAVALDHAEITPRHLDWLFAEDGGRIPFLLIDFICREGLSAEAGLEYAAIPGESLYVVADLLRQYGKYAGPDIYGDFPKFRNCFTMFSKVRAADAFSPLWGDTWGDGGKCLALHALVPSTPMALAGYRAYGGRELAREAWLANGRTFDGLRLDPYEPDPEAILSRLKSDLPEPASVSLESFNSGGYGSAFLQAPSQKHPRCLAMYYGRMIFHGHEDRLAIQVAAHGAAGVVDLGYPRYTGQYPERIGWTSHVASHNTCMVDDRGPKREASYSGKTQLFAETDGLRAVDVDGDGPRIYDGVRTYRRCLVMADVDEANSYAVDLFWVRGGDAHRLIQNGGGPEATYQGVTLEPQAQGTFAGKDVEFGSFYDGPRTNRYDGSGFMFLRRVERGRPRGDFWIDWRIADPADGRDGDGRPHVRLHSLTPVDEVALCDGPTPARSGNPPFLRYSIRSRFGDDLTSQFVSVIEPYAAQPFIRAVAALENSAGEDNCLAALQIDLSDGRRDIVLAAEQEAAFAAGGVALQGRVGFVRFGPEDAAGNRAPLAARLIEGTSLRARGVELSLPASAFVGTLVASDESDPAHTRLTLAPALGDGAGEVVGKYLIFRNQERSDASYRIEALVAPDTVSIGANSLAERLVGGADRPPRVVNNIVPGDAFRIARQAAWDAPQPEP
jgi:hypothetical protein